MRVYLGVAFHGAADGGAVTGHDGSVNQRLGKLGHTARVFLLEGASFVGQVYGAAGKHGQAP